MCLSKEEFQWLYTLVNEARLADNFELTCYYCPMINSIANSCNESFCNEIKRKLRICAINAKDDKYNKFVNKW